MLMKVIKQEELFAFGEYTSEGFSIQLISCSIDSRVLISRAF